MAISGIFREKIEDIASQQNGIYLVLIYMFEKKNMGYRGLEH